MNSPSSSPESFDLSRFQGWIDHYARMRGIAIVIDESIPAPMAMSDDIEHPRILVNPRMIHTEMNLTGDEKLVVFFHEIEHLFENIELQRTSAGKALYQQKMQKITDSMDKNHSEYLRGYGPRFHPETGAMLEQGAMLALENAIRDISVNREVVDPRKAPALRPIMERLYRMKAFRKRDYLTLPKHVQFQYTFLREAMLSDEECIVDPAVRSLIDDLRIFGTDTLVTEGGLITRLPAIWQHIEPTYRKWYEEDLEAHEQKKEKNGSGKEREKGEDSDKSGKNQEPEETGDAGSGESGEGKSGKPEQTPTGGKKGGGGEGEGGENQGEGQPGEDGNPEGGKEGNGEGIGAKVIKKLKEIFGGAKSPLTPPSEGEDGTGEQSSSSSAGSGGQKGGDDKGKSEEGEIGEQGGKNPFEEHYDVGIPHILPEKGDPTKPGELCEETLEKILRKIRDAQDAEANKSDVQKNIEARLKNEGFDPKNTAEWNQSVADMMAYEKFLTTLRAQKDRSGQKPLIESILNAFAKIKSRRMKPLYKSKGPVREDHSDGGLDMGAVSGAIADIMGGQSSSDVEMYTRQVVQEKIENHVGKFRLHLIADGSGSMSGGKCREQKKAILLILEALRQMTELFESDRQSLSQPLEFDTSGRIFSSSSVHEFKGSGPEFSDRDRLRAWRLLDTASGTTGDFVAISDIARDLDADTENLENIRKGKHKEIVIVMTDGESDDPTKLQATIATLRAKGVVIYGIDMAGTGEDARANYGDDESDRAGCGKSCPRIADLPQVFIDILAPHIAKL